MSLLILASLAILATIWLALLRVLRVRAGRSPLPEERARIPFLLAFFLVPPIVLGALTPDAGGSPLRGALWVPMYVLLLAGVAVVTGFLALLAGLIPPGRTRRFLMLALVGSQGDPHAMPFDPPLTTVLTERLALVDASNAAFPRGLAFPGQINRTGFRGDWDSLDDATRELELAIASDHRLGLAVGSRALAAAADARSRLDTLQGLAIESGQAWAPA
jgi:hypothetical protein